MTSQKIFGRLDDNWQAQVNRLTARREEPQFAFDSNRVQTFREKKDADKRSRRGIRALIRPENAAFLLDHLPASPQDRTHCMLRGDFVLCELIPLVIAARGRSPHVHISTLGLSAANADTLVALLNADLIGELTLVVSHYFQQVDKTTVYRAVESKLATIPADRCRLVVTRSHAKVICLPTASGDSYVFEGSANLRSSDNIEQLVITNDPDTLAFHSSWLEHLEEIHA